MNNPEFLLVDDNQFLSNGGEVGHLMRTKDWRQTPLGPVESWPQSLRTIVSVCLNSPFPVLVWWGKEQVNLYNDALRPLLGKEKHPAALGAPGHEIWAEIWDIVGPMLDGVLHEGQSTSSEHTMLLINRRGYTEEAYFTFSNSLVYDESGTIGGVFAAVTETTIEVISARELNALRELASMLSRKKDERDVCKTTIEVAKKYDKDFPFALIYQVSRDGKKAILAEATIDHVSFPGELTFDAPDSDPFNIRSVIESSEFSIVEDVTAFADLPKGGWKNRVTKVLLLPICQNGKNLPLAVLVVGLNPYRSVDDNLLDFYRLFVDRIASEIAALRNDEGGRSHARELAQTSSVHTAPTFFAHGVNEGVSAYKGQGRAATRREEVAAASPDGKPLTRILIADANADMQEYIKNCFDSSFLVETAGNVKSALEKLHNAVPDLVIMDAMMPEMDGIQLLQALKSSRDTQSIPVIILSEREQGIEGHETGADDYLEKPFSAKELLARVYAQIKIAGVKKHAENYIKNIFDQTPVRICLLEGPEFIIRQANPFMLNYWGKALEEVLNKPIARALPELMEQGLLPILRKVFEKGERFKTEEVPITVIRNGQRIQNYASFVYEPFKERDGKVSAIISIAHDVTDLVLARQGAQQNAEDLEQLVSDRTADLKKMNEELMLKNTELEQFTFLSSHDLQEPLRKIQTFSGLMEHNIHSPEAIKKYVQKINTSVGRMTGLIQSLLTYSNVSQSEFSALQVDLNLILKVAMEDLDLLITERGAVIKSENLPTINGNPRQLGQLFLNLIINAIKFCVRTPVISISFTGVTEEEKEELKLVKERGYVKLIFKDNGIGFKQQYSERIFQIFQRLHTVSEYPGTGIGLALCKKIAEKHSGTITAVSTAGEGSTFYVYLGL